MLSRNHCCALALLLKTIIMFNTHNDVPTSPYPRSSAITSTKLGGWPCQWAWSHAGPVQSGVAHLQCTPPAQPIVGELKCHSPCAHVLVFSVMIGQSFAWCTDWAAQRAKAMSWSSSSSGRRRTYREDIRDEKMGWGAMPMRMEIITLGRCWGWSNLFAHSRRHMAHASATPKNNLNPENWRTTTLRILQT